MINMISKRNIFASIPRSIPDEIFETIVHTPIVKIERIISQGQQSAPDFWYDQEQAEWVLILSGTAQLQFENNLVQLNVGDYINIDPHQKHRVVWTDQQNETIWLAIFY